MLLNYLYANFLEEADFAEACGCSPAALRSAINANVFPRASYTYISAGQSRSFVSDESKSETYQFHLKGHVAWMQEIIRFGISTEAQARQRFFARYDAAKDAFLSGDLGGSLAQASPGVSRRFDEIHARATWAHFLNGVYGVCTRDGQPETVFLKQIGVMFIEAMTAKNASALAQERHSLLERAVDFLDTVESEFAPHEVGQTSRQRCIVDVRRKLLEGAS